MDNQKVKQQFAQSIFSNNEDTDNILKEYDHFEKCDKDKEYGVEEYQYDYGFGTRTYEHHLYSIRDKEYVVAAEIVSKEELQKWKSANCCQCYYHQSSWYNPFNYFICKCCVGCIDSAFGPQQYVINKTREAFKKLNQ